MTVMVVGDDDANDGYGDNSDHSDSINGDGDGDRCAVLMDGSSVIVSSLRASGGEWVFKLAD